MIKKHLLDVNIMHYIRWCYYNQYVYNENTYVMITMWKVDEGFSYLLRKQVMKIISDQNMWRGSELNASSQSLGTNALFTIFDDLY